MKTYLLYDTEAEWNTSNEKAKTLLGIPTSDGLTTEYDVIKQVSKNGHTDLGKYIFILTDAICLNGSTLKSNFPTGQSLDTLGVWSNPPDDPSIN